MPAKPVTFIVRIWLEPEPFRAEARMVQAEKSRRFEKPEALLAYLTDEGLKARAGRK